MSERQSEDLFRASAADAAYALLQEEGVKGLSMRKLASHLGWSTQKLYSNFKNKDELLLAVALNLRKRIREHDLAVKPAQDPVRYLLDLTFNTLQFFVNEPAALEILMEQRYRLDAICAEDLNDPYTVALKALPGLSEEKAFDAALNAIRLLLVGATYCLRDASAAQRKKIFKGTEYALCSMLQGWSQDDR
ncbi:TetR/AcrR family transcriptional regulator [Chlamydiota bacterium]